MKRRLLALIVLTVLLLPAWMQAETVSDGDDRDSISLTVYNTDLALIRDVRRIALEAGRQTLALKAISANIQAETAVLEGEGLNVLEQNYEFDLLTPASLLRKYVGRQVQLVRSNPATGEENRVEATVLSDAGGGVLQIGDSIETGIDGRLVYPDVPANFREKPTLTMLVDNRGEGTKELRLSYLSGGISWQADYVVELNEKEDRLDLKGWVTVHNSSGADYPKARLKLVAGEVRQVGPGRPEKMMARADMAGSRVAGEPNQVSREALAEYHLYSLPRPVTLLDNQSKQIALLEEKDGICRKELVLRSPHSGYYWSKVGTIQEDAGVEIDLVVSNDRQANFGSPKPAGTYRVYTRDGDGFLQFIGEDRLGHTAENEEMRIVLGRSFDVNADRVQTDFAVISGGSREKRVSESEYAIELRNAKDQAVEVIVEENIPGDWQMLSESLPHSRESATTVRWRVTVPGKEETVLRYRVRTTAG